MRNILDFKKIIFLTILIGILSFSLPPELLAKKQKKLNVVLIVIDSLRAGHLSGYGYNRPTSPNIDRLGREGVLFSQAFSQGSCTSISMPAVFTSFYPAVYRGQKEGMRLPDEFITLPQILSKNGYITAAFVVPFEGLYNFDRRFQLYDTLSLREGLSRVVPQINKKAYDWLARNHAKPFFLYLHYPAAHCPYSPPKPYNAIFWQREVTDEMKEVMNSFCLARPDTYSTPVKQDTLDFLISQYDGSIRYIDVYIRAFLEELDRLGLSKNTLVILTADHGEGFSEHGTFSHGANLYDELIHVPLVIRLPERLPEGKVIPDLVRLIDIMPTVLDIIGIMHPANIMQGISLLPLIKGEKMPKLDAFSEAHLKPLRGIRADRWAFIGTYDSNNKLESYELYDLENDKKEMNNLAQKMPEITDMFKGKLRDYLSECAKIRSAILGEGFAGEPLVLDEETREALKSLGYMQ